MDDSQQEDCTVYIQELKSDNPALKLNAATKIGVIGSVLGHNRIKQQLIPYLIEIIEQMDNDNQFLINVCKGIIDLKQYCKGSNQLSALIYPLRVLASLDQPPVRDEAVKKLKQLPEGQNKDFYQKYFYPLVISLSARDSAYSPKIAACCLIPIIYKYVPAKQQAELRKIFKSFTFESDSPLVRRAVAQNIESFASVVEKDIIRGDFFQIWTSLISDTFDIIRIKAMQVTVVIAKTFKKQQNYDRFLKPIKLVDSNKKSWRVRYSLVQCLSSILPYLQKQVIKKDIVQMFQQLLKDQQAQVRAISLIKLPQLTSKLSTQQSWTVFYQYIEKAAKDTNKQAVPTVKLAVVQAIIPYFKTIQKQKLSEGGLTILTALLKDQNHNIRIGIMQKLMQLSDILGKQGTSKHLIPMIQGCLLDKKWRFKLAISQNIPNFFKVLTYDEHKQFLDKIINVFLKDHNFAVRQQTIKSIVASKSYINDKYYELLQKYVTQLSSQANYIYRVTAASVLQHVKGLDKSQTGQLLSILVKKMQTQKISNVLVAFFITFSKIKGQLPQNIKKQALALISKVKQQKKDEDVLYYASKCQE